MKSVSSVYRDHGIIYVIFVSLYWCSRLVAGLTAKGSVRYHVGPVHVWLVVGRVAVETGLSSSRRIFTRPVSSLHRSMGADKFLARPGRKATATKLLTFASHSKKKKFRKLSVQPALRGSNPTRRTKNGDLSIVFSNRVGLRTNKHPSTHSLHSDALNSGVK